MSFWANRLGQPTAPAAAPAAPPAPWWQAKPALPTVPQQTQVTPPQVPQQGSVAPSGEQHFGDLLRQDAYTTTKAKSARSGSCPDCGSNNYVGSPDQPNAAPHCFECGYNPVYGSTMTGVSGSTQQTGPPTPARVQNVGLDRRVPVGTVVQKA